MRRGRIAATALCLLAATAPAARAAGEDYFGECHLLLQLFRISRVNTGGSVDVAVVATDASGLPRNVPISVTCELVVNGVSQGPLVAASGTTVAAAVAGVSFTPRVGDHVQVCDNVTVGDVTSQRCHDPGIASPFQEIAQGGQARFPSGTIRMTGGTSLPTTTSFTGFDPPLSEWDCQTPNAGSATCVPPGQPHKNLCGDLTVAIEQTGLGALAGESGCGGPAAAAATSSATDSASDGASTARGTLFPWRCNATPSGVVIWTVTCTGLVLADQPPRHRHPALQDVRRRARVDAAAADVIRSEPIHQRRGRRGSAASAAAAFSSTASRTGPGSPASKRRGHRRVERRVPAAQVVQRRRAAPEDGRVQHGLRHRAVARPPRPATWSRWSARPARRRPGTPARTSPRAASTPAITGAIRASATPTAWHAGPRRVGQRAEEVERRSATPSSRRGAAGVPQRRVEHRREAERDPRLLDARGDQLAARRSMRPRAPPAGRPSRRWTTRRGCRA